MDEYFSGRDQWPRPRLYACWDDRTEMWPKKYSWPLLCLDSWNLLSYYVYIVLLCIYSLGWTALTFTWKMHCKRPASMLYITLFGFYGKHNFYDFLWRKVHTSSNKIWPLFAIFRRRVNYVFGYNVRADSQT